MSTSPASRLRAVFACKCGDRSDRGSPAVGNAAGTFVSRAMSAWPCVECSCARLACYWARVEQLPLPLGDDFDGAVDHAYGGLIVNRVPGC
jgi:hypothetical protein